jgi:hypothetical protein
MIRIFNGIVFGIDISVESRVGYVKGAADIIDGSIAIIIQLFGDLELALIEFFRTAALPSACPGSSKACLRPLPDDVPLEFSERTENMEDELAA